MKFNESKSSGLFVKINPGEEVIGVFRGEPVEYFQHFDEKAQKSIDCSGEGCPICADGEPARFQFKINFIQDLNGVYTARVFQGGAKIHRMLALINKRVPLDTQQVSVSREGSGKSTIYSVIPLGQVTPEVVTRLTLVRLQDLGNGQ